MTVIAKKQNYPYIETNMDIAGGQPIISGTRIAVRTIAGYYQMGMDVDEILTTLQHLTPSEVHSALAYYFDHKEMIDADLLASSDVDYWKSQIKPQSDEIPAEK